MGNNLTVLNNMLNKNLGQIARALPKHMSASRIARIALTEFGKNRDLQKCTPESICSCIVTSAQLGLEPGILGQSYLVPYQNYKTKQYICTLIPGWKGYQELINRAGKASLWTGAVYEGDIFDYQLGDSPFVKHRPEAENQSDDKLQYVYAIGRVKGHEYPIIEVWTSKKVLNHRNKTVNKKLLAKHYSNQHLEMYARKMPMLQVAKYLPYSIEMHQAMEVDLNSNEGHGSNIIDGEVTVIPDEEKTIDLTNNNAIELVNDDQIQLLRNVIFASGAEEKNVLNSLKLNALSDISVSNLNSVREQIEQTDWSK